MTEDKEAQENPAWWIDRIKDKMDAPVPPRPAASLVLNVVGGTWSEPAAVICDDGATYYVKGPHPSPRERRRHSRSIFTDHVVGHLGGVMGAPVAEVRIVELPKLLVDSDDRLRHIVPGPVHATVEIPSVRDSPALLYIEANAERFAALAVLYGWFTSHDEQFLYETHPPHRVFSADHGHFLPGGPEWTRTLLLREPSPTPNAIILGGCRFTLQQIQRATSLLRGINDADIADAVAAPAAEWGILPEDRVAVGMYLSRRRVELLRTFCQTFEDS